MCLPHVPQAAHSVLSDVLIRIVEVQKLQSISGTKFRPNLKQGLELRSTHKYVKNGRYPSTLLADRITCLLEKFGYTENNIKCRINFSLQ